MSDKPSVIPNWAYTKPSKGGHQGLKKLLKYMTFRENPSHQLLETHERWTDCGLGSHWKDVYRKLTELKGPYILAHHLVISPDPDLMTLIPESIRQEVVREVTERTIERWHTERGLNIPEYAYVMHRRQTNDDEKEQLHTHLFVAGTIEDESGERQSVRVNREQVVADPKSMQRADNLHRIARHGMETILDRTLGLEWRDIRAQQLAEQVPEPAPVDHPTDIQSLAAELGLEL